MKILTGHHFSFSVANLDRSRAFYAGVLGLEEIERPDFGVPGVWYRAGETEVHLIERPANVDTGKPSPELTSIGNHSAFRIEDYSKAVTTLCAAGAEFIELGREVGQILVWDPDSNIIELIEVGGRLGSLSESAPNAD